MLCIWEALCIRYSVVDAYNDLNNRTIIHKSCQFIIPGLNPHKKFKIVHNFITCWVDSMKYEVGAVDSMKQSLRNLLCNEIESTL